MYSLSIIASIISVLCLYAAASKVDIQRSGIILYLSTRVLLSRVLAGTAFLASILGLLPLLGPVSGTIGAVVLWILVASAVLLISPFNWVRSRHSLFLALLMFATEFLMIIINNAGK